MSEVLNGERLVTKQDLADMYQGILPYLGGMPEMLANKFSKGDLYSTEEKIIGQWVDGKPLYQKTIVFSTPKKAAWSQQYSANISVSPSEYNIPNLEKILAGFAHVNGWESPNGKYGTFYCGAVKAYDSDNILMVLLDSSLVYACTLQYTKTTDSAISIGSDTDYSTEEKIVGTWIDGSPLYQKTVGYTTTIGISNNRVVQTIATLDSNVQVKSFSGIFSTVNNVLYSFPYISIRNGLTINVESYIDENNRLMLAGYRTDTNTMNIANIYVTIQYVKTTT